MPARGFVYGLAGLLIGLAASTSVNSRSMLVIGEPDNSWSSDPGISVEHRTWGEARAEREEGLYPDYNETALGIINLDTSATHVMPIRVTPDFNLSLGYEERGGWQRERVFSARTGIFRTGPGWRHHHRLQLPG